MIYKYKYRAFGSDDPLEKVPNWRSYTDEDMPIDAEVLGLEAGVWDVQVYYEKIPGSQDWFAGPSSKIVVEDTTQDQVCVLSLEIGVRDELGRLVPTFVRLIEGEAK